MKLRHATGQGGVTLRADRRWPRASRWLGLGLDLVFPRICACCRDEFDPGPSGSLCPTCRAAMLDARPSCPRCGSSVQGGGDPAPCPTCQRERFHFDRVTRLGTYHGELRSAVLRIKRPHERALAAALSDLLVDAAGVSLAALAPDVVVPVPMHWTRKVWRGANSPDVIAQRLAGHLGVPMRADLLARRRRTAPQASLAPSRRRANVRGAFRAAKHPDLPGARIVLVDDIMTTGATVDEAAKTLSKCGSSVVAVVVLARAEGLA